MPEAPECHFITDQLQAKFGGQTLTNISIEGGRFKKDRALQARLDAIYWSLTDVQMRCKGKFLYWEAKEYEPIWFFITLGMTGSFGSKTKHSALRFDFDSDSIYFNDPRHFGTFKVVGGAGNLNEKLASLGWDPLLSDGSTPNDILPKLRKQDHKTIAEVMLNQKIFAGLGNWLRSEILYQAAIHPNTSIELLTDKQLLAICHWYSALAWAAYKAGGASLATYVDIDGKPGAFHSQFKVYGRNQDPDGREVKKLTAMDGRSVWYVPELQVRALNEL
jgi:formamidopyrimidine-DNA glycosylase